ncbi:MAG: type II toxin-antitoxin system Phd/YefM family antitoxin [Panacagrimonas sp.]
MDALNVHEAKAQLSSILDRVEAGETVRLARRNKVIAEIRPVAPEQPKGKRPIGLMKGRFTVPDSFFDPLPDDLLRKMLGED